MPEETQPEDRDLSKWTSDKACQLRIDNLIQIVNKVKLLGLPIGVKQSLDVLYDEAVTNVPMKPSDIKEIDEFKGESDILMTQLAEFAIEHGVRPKIQSSIYETEEDFFDRLIDFRYPVIREMMQKFRLSLESYNLVLRRKMQKYGLLMGRKKDIYDTGN